MTDKKTARVVMVVDEKLESVQNKIGSRTRFVWAMQKSTQGGGDIEGEKGFYADFNSFPVSRPKPTHTHD